MADPLAVIGSHYAPLVIPQIEAAEKSISIVVFDWRWYPTISGSPISRFNAAIVAASKRGVAVRALVNNDEVLTRLRSHGIECRRLHSKKMLHTKMILFDDVKLVIGSHNFTQHGFSLNEEASVLVELPSQDNDFVKYFEALWGV